MRNRPTESGLAGICRVNEGTEVPLEDRIVHMHFFCDGRDWYLVEYDPVRRVFFGLFVPDKDNLNARWGHFSLEELAQRGTPTGQEVVRNLDWIPKRAFQVDRIRDACGWTRHCPNDTESGGLGHP